MVRRVGEELLKIYYHKSLIYTAGVNLHEYLISVINNPTVTNTTSLKICLIVLTFLYREMAAQRDITKPNLPARVKALSADCV